MANNKKRTEQGEEFLGEANESPKSSVPLVSLTVQALVAHIEAQKADAIRNCVEGETMEVLLPKFDANGNKVRGPDGFSVTESKRVLKSEWLAKGFDEQISRIQKDNFCPVRIAAALQEAERVNRVLHPKQYER